ncbi:hypothetical protein [Paractinoplanes atraurantiacus]|uniref:Uncharacterized protein n=1 Tax=Paractinoplanes atraurantiacus TaxID=1036182 RepID=A0A285INF5_9ACTN|nr:hypothetical protein [Actinoplanes atraurantiacus]SNY49529.1 hypothetical protein SAMN05421748_11036 [Actinoplanes atraurantiacus]
MTTYETADLHTRVARYEAALEELRAAHQDVRSVLQDQILYERWQQMGADLGFVADQAPPPDQTRSQRDLQSLNEHIPQMSDSWAS